MMHLERIRQLDEQRPRSMNRLILWTVSVNDIGLAVQASDSYACR
jgi:hypothetical protein